MSRTHVAIAGTGSGSAYQALDVWGYQTAEKVRNDLALAALAVWGRNIYGGGSEINGIGVGVGTGYVTAYDSIEFEIDNTSNQVSSSSLLVCQVRLCVRVVDTISPASGISVTPRVYNVTDSSVPTQSGAAACTATNSAFSGSNQKQTISFTPANGKKKYVVQVAKSADSDEVVCCKIAWDLYIAG